MLYEEFTQRLKNLCRTLGFSARWMREKGEDAGGGVPELSWRWTGKDEAVIFLSCRVPYNLNWGGYCGQPQLLVQPETGSEEHTPAAFIAPYLQEYRFARQHVFLGVNEQGEHFITLPASHFDKPERAERCGRKLIIDLDRVARPNRDGHILPSETSGPMRSFALSDVFLRDLHSRGFACAPGRSMPIGRYLGSELFTFVDTGDAAEQDSLLGATLLPHLGEIVSHPTPNLRAAEIHLGRIFSRTVATLRAEYNRHNVLCLVGLDIDMSNFMDHKEHCFVPWKAYLARQGEASLFLEQDELFVRLMQEKKERERVETRACLERQPGVNSYRTSLDSSQPPPRAR